MIDSLLQQALDGERDPATLPADLREAYARLTGAVRLLEVVPAASVADRVMAEIRGAGAVHGSTAGRRLMRWWTRPRDFTVRLRPAWTLAVAAALMAILLLPAERDVSAAGAAEGVTQFVGHFPDAHSVEVVGSFNDWSRGALALRDDDHDGIWHARVVLPAGQHEYMFVVDGERWVSDPLAGRYVDDGFGAGSQNALLIVRPAR